MLTLWCWEEIGKRVDQVVLAFSNWRALFCFRGALESQ